MALLSKLRNRIAPHAERERGAVLVLTALVMLLLLFIAAFATDLGAWYRQGQEQQRAADVSALNGVQAYDRGVKAHFATLPHVGVPPEPVQSWAQLTPDQWEFAERAGLAEAANTIIALMETSGLSFTDIGTGVLASNPTDPTSTSIWTIVATDGTEIIITRSFVQTGLDTSTPPQPTYSRSIDVQVNATGEQYFSNILRDAPSIDRSASSVLSNCGAICEQTVEIDPPFAGFDADGKGDGYSPLLYGDQSIWAVNHHVNDGWEGDILCMDRTVTPPQNCGEFALSDYNTASYPVELLSNNVGKIYAPATNRATDKAGLLCFNVAKSEFCDDEFIGFDGNAWQSNNKSGSPAAGVWEYKRGNSLEAWVLSHKGEIACVTMSASDDGGMDPCGSPTGIYNTAIVGHTRIHTGTGNRTVWGELIADELFLISRGQQGDPLFHCFNLNSRQPCPGFGVIQPADSAYYRSGEAMGFIRHSAGGGRDGFCLASPRSTKKSYCVNFGGTKLPDMPNSFDNNVLAPIGVSWVGKAYTWNSERTFFSGGNSDLLTCWDWSKNLPCAETIDLDVLRPGNKEVRAQGPRPSCSAGQALPAGTSLRGGSDCSQEIEPYNLAAVTPNCLVGLGDQSYFFSFNPRTMEACVDTTLSADIEPCDCADSTEKRWGLVRLPVDLLGDVNKLDATVVDPATGAIYIGALPSGPLDLLGNGGELDLSHVPDTVPLLKLNLDIDAKLDSNGDPLWTGTKYADIQIEVQPTLAN